MTIEKTTSMLATAAGIGAGTLYWFAQSEPERQDKLRRLQLDSRDVAARLNEHLSSGDWFRLTRPVVRDFLAGMSTAQAPNRSGAAIPSTPSTRPDLTTPGTFSWPPVTAPYNAAGNPEAFGEMARAAQVLTYEEPRAWSQGLTQKTAPGPDAKNQIFYAANALAATVGSLRLTLDQYQAAWQRVFASTSPTVGLSFPLASAPPPDISGTGSAGTSFDAARGNHTHGHGDQAGGSLHALVTPAAPGFMSSSDKTKLDGIAAGATATPLATVAPPNIAAASAKGSSTKAALEDHTHGHGDQGGGTQHAAATLGSAGFMSAADKTKLDGVAVGATNIPLATAAPPNIAAASAKGTSTKAALEDHTHGHGDQGGGTQHAAATPGSGGFMSATDKTKLDGVATGATSTPLATAAPPNIAAASAKGSSTKAALEDHTHGHGDQGGGTQHAAATSGSAGFMSAADKTKLDSLPTSSPGQGLRLHLASTAMLLPGASFGCDGSVVLFGPLAVPDVCTLNGKAVDWTLEAVAPTSSVVNITILQAPSGGGLPSTTGVVLKVAANSNKAISNVALSVSRGDRITAQSDSVWSPQGLTLRARVQS